MTRPLTFRPLPLRPLVFAFGVCAAGAVFANPPSDAEIAALRQEAQALRDHAEHTFAASQPQCYARFLVNRCLDQAREARLSDIQRARELDIQASRLELVQKQREFAARHGQEATPIAPPAELPAPTVVPTTAQDEIQRQADELRRARAVAAAQAEARADAEQRRRDAERTQERAEAEAAAARRAEQAERDRQRYQERLDARQAEQAREAEQVGGEAPAEAVE